MNWGYRIALVYIAFVAFMLFMVVRATQESFDLVSNDYYQQEIRYQDRINQTQNTLSLAEKPKIAVAQGGLNILFPQALAAKVKEGEIYLFRPSDASLDSRHKLQIDPSGSQTIDTKSLQSGVYELKLSWTMDNKAYYWQERIYL